MITFKRFLVATGLLVIVTLGWYAQSRLLANRRALARAETLLLFGCWLLHTSSKVPTLFSTWRTVVSGREHSSDAPRTFQSMLLT